jgi:hypothetical protein
MQAITGEKRRALTADFVILSKGHPLSSDQGKSTTTPTPRQQIHKILTHLPNTKILISYTMHRRVERDWLSSVSWSLEMEGSYKFLQLFDYRYLRWQLGKFLLLLLLFHFLFIEEWMSEFLFLCIVPDAPSADDPLVH